MLAVAAWCCAFGETARADNFVAWQGNAAHNGLVSGAGVAPPLQRAWSDRLGFQNRYVLIDGADVVALSRVSSSELDVVAIDLATGRVLWRRSLGNASDAYLALDSGDVFVVSRASSSGLVAAAFDAQTGRPLWIHQQLLASPTSLNPPVAQNGTLFVDAGALGGTDWALRESDGSVVWSTGLALGSAPTLADGVDVIAGVCGLSYGLGRDTGAILWADNLDGCAGNGTTMSSFNGTYLWGPTAANGQSGAVYDPQTGAAVGTFAGYAPAFGYGEAINTSYSPSNSRETVEAFDPALGTVHWAFTQLARSIGTTPLVADGYVFVAGGANQVWALNACTGSIAWHSSTSVAQLAGVPPGLAAGNGYLVVPGTSGLTAFKGHPAGSPVPTCYAPAIPSNVSSPTISGTPQQGSTLSDSHGQWSNAPTSYRYQWEACNPQNTCYPIQGATSSSYTVSSVDVGLHLVVEETGVNADGAGAASGSAATAVVLPLPPSILVSPTISGNATQGQTLIESDGTWTHSPTTYGYQWSDCDRSGDNCRLIFGATHRTYTLIARDVGHTIRVQQSASNAGGSGTATSPASAVVQPTPGPPSNLANISPSVTGRLGPVAATRWNATLRTALSKALVVSKRATTIGQVIRHNGYVTTFSAPRGGLLLISWYFVPKRGQRAGGKQPVRMATARLRFVHRGVRKIKITLTPAGRRLLRGATRIAITAKDSFAPGAGPTIRATRTLRLRR